MNNLLKQKKFENELTLIIKSIGAGFMIALSCLVYISTPNKMLGSALFSVGLIVILTRDLSLFTGRLCFLRKNSFYTLFLTWVSNFIGVFILMCLFDLIAPIEYKILAQEIYFFKSGKSFLEIFILGILCEVMINIAVVPFKNKELSDIIKLVSTVLGVFVFVYCGFEHCVANMFYFLSASSINGLLLIPSTLGNIFGAMVLTLFSEVIS